MPNATIDNGGNMADRRRKSVAASLPRLGRPRDWLIGATLLVGLFIAVDQGVGWTELLLPWRTLSPWLLIVAVLLTALSYLLRAVRAYDFFGDLTRGRFTTMLRLSVLHNTANNLLPMRTGEMLFPWLMRRYFGHGFLASGASLLWIRLLDMHVLGLAGVVVLWLRDPAWIWSIAALAWLGLLPATARLIEYTLARPGGSGRLWRIARFVAAAGPARPRMIARLYLWTALCWLFKLVAFAVVLRHFVAVAFWQVLAGVLGAELSSVLPFHGIAGAGSYELATVAAMVPFGVGATEALAGAVNLHLFLLGTTLLLGLSALMIPTGPIADEQRAG